MRKFTTLHAWLRVSERGMCVCAKFIMAMVMMMIPEKTRSIIYSIKDILYFTFCERPNSLLKLMKECKSSIPRTAMKRNNNNINPIKWRST
jgi:hypothetical protein